MEWRQKIAIVLFLLLFLFTATEAKALTLPNPLKYETFEELAEGLIKVFFSFGIAFCGLAVVIGAFFILTAGGEPARWKRGRDIILYALLGFTIILLARGISSFIRYLFGVKPEEESVRSIFLS